MSSRFRLCLTGNEPRQQYLFKALEAVAEVKASVPFDDIDPVTKYLAAALSFDWPKTEWWGNYQMHPLLQQRRRKVLQQGLAKLPEKPDALLMWGSWFQPFLAGDKLAVPYFCYIDQSRSLDVLPGERKAAISRRRKSHELQARTYDAAGAIFCMSEWARQQTLEAHTVAPEKVITVGWGPCGMDLSNEDPSTMQREPLVLHVSNDFYRKGVDYLIETAKVVRKAIPNARFVVIGQDSGGMTINNDAGVEFLGRIADKKVLGDYFRKASLFFLPHRFDRSPHVLAESMSAGLPIVASAQGGAIEVIQGQDNGFLCQSGNIGEYSDAIISLLRDDGLRNRMGHNGQQLMKRKYNWASIARNMIELMAARLK